MRVRPKYGKSLNDHKRPEALPLSLTRKRFLVRVQAGPPFEIRDLRAKRRASKEANSREGEPKRAQDEQAEAHHCRRARGWRKPLHSFSLKSHSLFLAPASYACRSARASRVPSK